MVHTDIQRDPRHLERLQALADWRETDGSYEAFEAWLKENKAIDTVDRIVLQLSLMRAIKAGQSGWDFELSQQLAQTLDFSALLSRLAFEGRPRCANQICLLPQDRSVVAVVGDLHADAASLLAALRASDFLRPWSDQERPTLVCLGDYVDRGENHLGILEGILALKFCYPNHVILLKGNHDGGFTENNGTVKTPYFVGEDEDMLLYFPHLMRHLELTEAKAAAPFLCEYLSFFDTLPVLCAWRSGDQTMLALHGGILRPRVFNRALTEAEPYEEIDRGNLATENQDLVRLPKIQWYEEISCLSALTAPSPLDAVGRSRLQNLMWSDPTEHVERMRWHTGRFKFTREHFEAFMAHIGCHVLFRGHVVQNDGLLTYFDQQLYSVYSTGGGLKAGFNRESAYPEVTPAIVVATEGQVEKRSI